MSSPCDQANGTATVTPIRTSTGDSGQSLRVPSTACELVISPAGKTLYVEVAAGIVSTRTTTDKARRLVKVAMVNIPGQVVVAPDSRTIYVARDHDDVIAVDAASGKLGTRFDVGEPFDLAITPSGRALYVLDFSA